MEKNTRSEALKLFEIDESADISAIRSAWRRYVQKNHPDLHGGKNEYVEKIQRANAAYEMLREYELHKSGIGFDASFSRSGATDSAAASFSENTKKEQNETAFSTEPDIPLSFYKIYRISVFPAIRVLFFFFFFLLFLLIFSFSPKVPFLLSCSVLFISLGGFLFLPGKAALLFSVDRLIADDESIFVEGACGGEISWSDIDFIKEGLHGKEPFLIIVPRGKRGTRRRWYQFVPGVLNDFYVFSSGALCISESDLGFPVSDAARALNSMLFRRKDKRHASSHVK